MKPSILFLSSLTLLLCRCGAPEKNTLAIDSIGLDTITLMRDSISSPVPVKKTTYESPEDFPSEWVRITELDKEFVIYRACDSENPTVIINRNGNGFDLTNALGQFADLYKISDFKPLDSLSYEIYCEGQGLDSMIVNVTYTDKKNGVAEWTWKKSSTNEVVGDINTYVEKGFEKNYREYKEICEEL
ncbi:MAG TPA: hypothetical protein VNB90_16275 [Cytophagaceae bacterium]|nr:hypothetical protein [Cytophagaceae bacterium]